MACPAQPARLTGLYRALLRELPARPVLAAPRSSLHRRLRDAFSGPPATGTRLALAEQAVAYLRAQRTYAALLDRYNPGAGMDDEERVRLTARRVGMDFPVEYGAGGGGGQREGS